MAEVKRKQKLFQKASDIFMASKPANSIEPAVGKRTGELFPFPTNKIVQPVVIHRAAFNMRKMAEENFSPEQSLQLIHSMISKARQGSFSNSFIFCSGAG